MHPNFALSPANEFIRHAGIPGTFRGVRIPGSVAITAMHRELGMMVLQQLHGKHFTISFTSFEVLKACSIDVLQPASFLTAILPVKNNLRCTFKEFKQPAINQGQFALFHCNTQEAIVYFDKPGLYEIFTVSWSQKIVDEFLSSFALLRSLREEKNLRRSFPLTPYNKTAGYRSLGMAHSLMRFPQKDPNAGYLFEHKVKEYLLSLLIAAERVPASSGRVNNNDLAKVHALYDQLRSRPEKRFPISELAREANMGEKKLKRLFGQVFGMPIFEFHLAARMKEAHRLLEENEYNTKQIAAMVGYQLTTSFITKFREFYGYPPSVIRKKH